MAFSIYQVSVANEWKDQLRSQVLTWCGPIAAGFVDSGVGTLVGPIGAILGGICGGIIGSPQGGGNDPWLSNWFYGGSSSATAAEMLGASLSQARDVVIESIKQSNAQFVIHQVRKSQLSKISNDSSQAKSAVQSMVNSPLGGQISDGSDEVCLLESFFSHSRFSNHAT